MCCALDLKMDLAYVTATSNTAPSKRRHCLRYHARSGCPLGLQPQNYQTRNTQSQGPPCLTLLLTPEKFITRPFGSKAQQIIMIITIPTIPWLPRLSSWNMWSLDPSKRDGTIHSIYFIKEPEIERDWAANTRLHRKYPLQHSRLSSPPEPIRVATTRSARNRNYRQTPRKLCARSPASFRNDSSPFLKGSP